MTVKVSNTQAKYIKTLLNNSTYLVVLSYFPLLSTSFFLYILKNSSKTTGHSLVRSFVPDGYTGEQRRLKPATNLVLPLHVCIRPGVWLWWRGGGGQGAGKKKKMTISQLYTHTMTKQLLKSIIHRGQKNPRESSFCQWGSSNTIICVKLKYTSPTQTAFRVICLHQFTAIQWWRQDLLISHGTDILTNAGIRRFPTHNCNMSKSLWRQKGEVAANWDTKPQRGKDTLNNIRQMCHHSMWRVKQPVTVTFQKQHWWSRLRLRKRSHTREEPLSYVVLGPIHIRRLTMDVQIRQATAFVKVETVEFAAHDRCWSI